MILDAYNILHRLPAWKPLLEVSLAGARETLLNYCRRWIMQRGDVWLFVVVFDGDSSVVGAHSSAGPGVRVVYSPTGQAADDRILEVLREFGEKFDYVVVSDDRYVTGKAVQLGATAMTSSAFGAVLTGGMSPTAATGGGKQAKGRRRTAEEDDALPPDAANDITESLRRLWDR
jgi:predicted RNA-binding protein with PIN domain